MFFKCLDTGMLQSNCYIIGVKGDGDGMGEAAVIDPGVDCEEIAQVLDEQGLRLKYIIMTHAHVDHILQLNDLHDKCGGKTVIHEEDEPLLQNMVLNGSVMFGNRMPFRKADMAVKDGDVLALGRSGALKLEIIHTPGHTPGSMCIKATLEGANIDKNGYNVKECLFTGDTLFRLAVGRTDLGAGDSRRLTESLQRLMELDDSLKVYPGHGPATEIGYEKNYNRFLL